jgi:hypothetical protein
MSNVTIDQAISHGTRIVNLPVFAFLCTPAVVLVGGRHTLARLVGEDAFSIAVVILFCVCFIAAWLWWSVQVPKWRLWAYEHVENIPELKRRAIEAQLIWPDGSIFARTEIKSAAHAARERELEKSAGDIRVSTAVPGAAPSLLAKVCMFGGAAAVFFSLLWPLVRLAVPGPLYYMGEMITTASVALVVGLVGCLLSGDFRGKARAFISLSFGGVLMAAGGGALVGLVVAKPANALTPGAAVAAAMWALGYILVRMLRRAREDVENVA